MRKVFDKHEGQTSPLFFDKPMLILLVLGMIACSSLLSFYHSVAAGQQVRSSTAEVLVTNGSEQWVNDTTLTRPSYTFALPVSTAVAVAPLFARYYQRYHVMLGNPLTVAFPIAQGWIQFFTSGALLMPATQAIHVRDSEDVLTTMLLNGIKDAATGIVRLPLLQGLLTVGSLAPIVVADDAMTYADLRNGTSARLLQKAPVKALLSLQAPDKQQRVFVQGGTRAGSSVGHFVPQVLWDYIHRADVSPGGWLTDVGPPITEALPVTTVLNGQVHHLLVQAFLHEGLILDSDQLDASAQPVIMPLPTGLAYLRTMNIPDVMVKVQQQVWMLKDNTILSSPKAERALAHVGQNFPLILLGDTSWNAGMLWYHVQWNTPKRSKSGWVQATAITFSTPGQQPVTASFDVLSPELADYLASIGSDAGVVLYDVTHQRYYTYNSNASFIVASSMKVPIMLTFLDQLEQQGREPDDGELNLLTTMIENSNNDSASELYYNEIGGPAGITSYLQKIGVTGLEPDGGAWGYSLITPQAMVDLLTLLDEDKILTPNDRALALNLMENVEPDQQVGVGTTAPAGAIVAMKDGWVTEDDALWAMNSSGIITSEQETYILAVYTQEQLSLDNGQAIVTQVCSMVTTLFS